MADDIFLFPVSTLNGGSCHSIMLGLMGLRTNTYSDNSIMYIITIIQDSGKIGGQGERLNTKTLCIYTRTHAKFFFSNS